MHELALAHNVVDILCEEARRHGLRRVSQFKLRVGVLRAVVPELLETCLGFASRGTLAEGATPVFEVMEGRARCAACGESFAVEELLFLCPHCGGVGGEILAGQELALVEMEGE